MTNRPLLSKWLTEFASPVVVTIATAEAEGVCLKNGLLFHDLLSAFGHLDNVSSTVRSVNQQISFTDAHIRFERSTEVAPRSAAAIEELLRGAFQEFELSKLHSSTEDARSSPPAAWSNNIEHLILRSMAFSEYEMTSHPLIFMTVVSTSDVDHIACMQELCSQHHVPHCFHTGQYEPDIHRVYVLLHDNSAGTGVDPNLILRQLKSKFSPTHTKLLCINSLPEASANINHPDIWTRWKIPLFYSQHAPSLAPNALPMNPQTQQPAYGCRLSMEDFMNLRNFCIELFHQEVLPALERRVGTLGRIVNDAKKGMKNVFKSFWRKPRDTSTHTKGVAKYKYDRIESQILLLGDTAFNMRDYDAALSMYRLVKDDYKADKSAVHAAHVNLMMAACQLMLEPGYRNRELASQLEVLQQFIQTPQEPLHSCAYFALILSEILVANAAYKSPLESAQYLLLAAASVSKLPLLSSLFTERAAMFFLRAGQERKYTLNLVLAGYKYNQCALPSASNHAAVCFATSMLFYEEGNWGSIRVRLMRLLADELLKQGKDQARRAFLLLLKIVTTAANAGKMHIGKNAFADAVAVYQLLMRGGPWSGMKLQESWKSLTTYQLLLSSIPMTEIHPSTPMSYDIEANVADSCSYTLVENLSLPLIDMNSIVMMEPINGTAHLVPFNSNAVELRQLEYMTLLLGFESLAESSISNFSLTTYATQKLQVENSYYNRNESRANKSDKIFSLPLGEQIILKFTIRNSFPIDIAMHKLRLTLEKNDSFLIKDTNVVAAANSSMEISLSVKPTIPGTFRILSADWELSSALHVTHALNKPGPLLQRTLQQRAHKERGTDMSTTFTVIPPLPLLYMSVNSPSTTVLAGEIFLIELMLDNQGDATACAIDIMLSHPCFVIEHVDASGEMKKHVPTSFLPYTGYSQTVVQLPRTVSVTPGDSIKLSLWMRLTEAGPQNISILSAYACGADGMKDDSFARNNQNKRSSLLNVLLSVKPSVHVAMNVIGRPSSSSQKSLLVHVSNILQSTPISEGANAAGYMSHLEEGSCCVEGIMMLGGAAHNKIVHGMNVHDVSGNSSTPLRGAEKMSVCIPINQMKPDETKPASNHWLLKTTETHTALLDIFSVVSFNNVISEEEMKECRLREKERQMMGADAAPRSIAQVRRDNRRSQMTSVTNVSDLTDDERADNVELDLLQSGLLKHVQNVDAFESVRQNVTIGIAWVCRLEGKLRHGLHLLHRQALSSTEVSEANAAEKLSVGMVHAEQCEWDFSTGHAPIDVCVELKSMSVSHLCVSIEALDWIDISSDSMQSSAGNPIRRKHPARGLRWEGKSRFVDIDLPPYSVLKLPFLALVTQPGIYDMKRFRVLVGMTHNELYSAVVKDLYGQSLVKVESK